MPNHEHGHDMQWMLEQLRLGMSAGIYPAGSWMRQDSLAENYQVSRFLVRGALERLAELGSLEHVPNRGYRVRHWQYQERLALTEARISIELALIPLMMARQTPEGLIKAQRAQDQFEAAVTSQDGPAMVKANHQFHRALAALAGNEFLAHQVNWLREQGLQGAGPGWPQTGGLERSIEEHRLMLEALLSRDPISLQQVIQQHLSAWKQRHTIAQDNTTTDSGSTILAPI
ncbi:hypothetical protein BFW38_17235 [Terasakiispira papahanaumokuakeensis]|uniref:GntR C-terminal domain-containing protein n=1 Tax=Terasakiispira papahanaumokuakeensis TaxID=197479 RepID=A0A1E2VDG2_9GAMM|nr:GntR family transcriptional regulator [Terasakiispira papahanaumokuakeensis]ODC05017.1 hypothetical protein BFW38_17235 [Terasakiispira papahanaumokuakeensis]